MKYMVAFTGFHYVEADSEEEAMEKVDDEATVYSEYSYKDPVEVDEFTVRLYARRSSTVVCGRLRKTYH